MTEQEIQEEETLLAEMQMFKACLPKRYKLAFEQIEKSYAKIGHAFDEEVRKANNQAIEWVAELIEGNPKYFQDAITQKLYKIGAVHILQPPSPDTKITEFVIS